jgi:predicted porin
MNKKLNMAVASAVLAMGATAAQAGITIPAGDWTIDIGGNVNAFYTHTKYKDDFKPSCDSNGCDSPNNGIYGKDTANVVQTGLLPSALGIGGKTRQNDLDIAFQFTFFTGADSGGGSMGGSGGNNSLNIRQAYLTFGDKSWGTIKGGRDLGIFGSDAILSDMTLLGVGVGAGSGGSSTLGRIGSGYMYADWVGQISYASPNWNGFSFAVGLREPWTNGYSSDTLRHDMGYEGKVAYEWGGDFSGKVWGGYISQKMQYGVGNADYDGYTANSWEIGGKLAAAGFEGVLYYYDGNGISGSTAGLNGDWGTAGIGILNGLMFRSAKETKDKGGYAQATYKIPGIGTKLGLSYGESKSEDDKGPFQYDYKNKSWIFGVYHPLTKSLNLVAEYTDQKVENDYGFGSKDNNLEGKAQTISLGAIMFF